MLRSQMICFMLCLLLLTLAGCGDDKDAPAQPAQLQRLANLPLGPHITDVWGYVDANTDKEYALVGFGNFNSDTSSGVHVVDVSDAANPVRVARINTVPGFDIKVWQNYMYTVNGAEGEGGIVDLSDPAHPVKVGTFPSGHNLFISENGFLYLETGFRALQIFDLNGDPLNPNLVWSANNDGHDAAVIGNRLYDFGGFAATNIYDVTDPTNPQLLSSITAPFVRFHHSGWPTEDGNYLFICNELAVHPEPDITIWDIRDVRNPKFVADYKDPNNKVHNLYIIGDFAFVSYYNAGLRIFDVSDPADIDLVVEFDTSTGVGQRFDGAFGVYPFAPSGNIYLSDVTTGLHIFSFDPNPENTSKIVAP